MKKTYFIKIFKAISKSFLWNFLCITAGLFQLVVLFILTKLRNEPLDADKFFKDGFILFFCSAFIVTSTIDYFFNEFRYPKLFEAIFLYALPIGTILFIVILYCGVTGFAKINIDLLKQGTYACFLVSVLYSLVFQTLKFHLWRSK